MPSANPREYTPVTDVKALSVTADGEMASNKTRTPL